MQALRALDAAYQAGDDGGAEGAESAARQGQAAFVQGALIRRLQDEDASVVNVVLSLPSLRQVPGPLLYSGLAAVLDRFDRVTGLNSDKGRHKAWRAVAKKVMSNIHVVV